MTKVTKNCHVDCFLLNLYCFSAVAVGCIDLDDENGESYRGGQNVNKLGTQCQRWDAQSPTEHTFTGVNG